MPEPELSVPTTAPSSTILSAKGDTDVREPNTAERGVARRTAEARATVPDVELSIEVAAEAALERCSREPCSLDATLMSACASALRAVPEANAAYRDGRFERFSRINVGFVVATEDTFLIPTIFDADRKSLRELTEEIDQLTADAAARRLPSPAFSGATFTLWNAGALGLHRAGIVINPPQSGALTAGAVRTVPVIRGGAVIPGAQLTLTLACDHRILYGARAARLLDSARTTLEAL